MRPKLTTNSQLLNKKNLKRNGEKTITILKIKNLNSYFNKT